MTLGHVRIPLQTGATALRTLRRIPVVAVPVAVFIGMTVVGNGRIVDLLADPHHSPAPAIGASLIAVLFAARAYRQGATEVGVEAGGLRLNGRPLLAWAGVAAVRVTDTVIVDDVVKAGTRHRLPAGIERKVMLERPDRPPELLARSADLDEEASLDSVASALQGACAAARDRGALAPAGADPAADARRPSGELVLCPACGAAVAPAATTTVPCHFCAAEVPVPEPVRAKIAAASRARQSDRLTDTLVADLLRQPSTARVNAWLAGFGAVQILVGLALWLFATSGWSVAVPLGFAALVLLVGGLARRVIADRVAIAAVVGSAARAPREASGPWTCHRCGAPLPRAGVGELVIPCVHCAADNVTGLDLVAGAATRSASVLELTAAFARRDVGRKAGLARVGVGAVLGLAAVLLAARP